MNKKLISITLASIMMVAMVLSGCSGSGEVERVDETARLVVGTASASGTGFMFGTAFSDVINNHCDTVNLTAVATPGSADNIEKLRRGDLKIGFTSSDWIYKSYNGIGLEENKDLRILWAMYSEYFHMMVRADNPADTIYDLLGQKVSFGTELSGSYNTAQAILETLDLSFDDYDAKYLPTSESISALEDGQIDAALIISGMPHPGTMSLAATLPGGIKLIGLSEEDIQKVVDAYPYMAKTVIPKGTYTGVDYDVEGVGGQRYLATSVDLPDEVGYTIAKVVTENHDELVQAYAGAFGATAENTAAATVAPIHSGVEKYLKEIGAM